MKKNYSLWILCISVFTANAQLPNSSFEELVGENGIKNWGQFFATPVAIDISTGAILSDIIIYDGTVAFSGPTADAHTGSGAMEIRNAFNQTQSTVIPGNPSLFNSEISEEPTGWNRGIPVPQDTVIQQLGFYYKFFPLGNDIAHASMELFDAEGTSIGTAVIEIAGTVSDYTYVSVPVAFTSSEIPAFMTLEFSMATEGSDVTLGSMLVIDDISVNTTLQLNEQTFTSFKVYPGLAADEINILPGNTTGTGNIRIEIANITGAVIKEERLLFENNQPYKMNISDLSAGVYFCRVSSEGNNFSTKFIKR